jgi:SanA protein
MMARRILKGGFYLLLGAVLFVVGCNIWILQSTKAHVYTNIEELPVRRIGLILGTSKSIDGRYINPYFSDRIESGLSLLNHNRIKHIIVSGDNSLSSYNEPLDMRNALLERGVDKQDITMDFAGFRTFDSVVRCKEVFDQSEITIISQPFHTPRAVFIARRKGLNAIAFNADDDYTSFIQPLFWREVLARCKTVIDLYIIHKKPRYLGDKEIIEIRHERT